MRSSADIRQQFIDFFVQKHGHTFVPSSPVVPHDDPTLLFTNAGMNQFKPVFLGLEKRDYTRVANTQKCIRAGGKHNDLDDVGRSRRHHTFFEMLGNWSFGDYFKRDAIAWSWELLTKVWGLDPSRLHVTVHAGDEAIGVPCDDEAANLWREVAGVAKDHIHYGNTKDNFWEMGETGPCGPCTEIFVDRTPDKSGGPTVLTGDDPRVMEIWNNVFIQYNRNPDRSLTPLPAKHVDTGMGLERIIQVLQGVNDNYAIDLFNPFWEVLSKLSGGMKYTGRYPRRNSADPDEESGDAQLRHDIACRVIADHIRCLTFAITDGASPSNEGRGYVLRRILRRAVFFGRQHLNIRGPFLYGLVPIVIDVMGAAFPELSPNAVRVMGIVKEEEANFGHTLDRGMGLVDEAVRDAGRRLMKESEAARAYAKSEHEAGRTGAVRDMPAGELEYAPPPDWSRFTGSICPTIRGSNAFILHDTYGFPIDLTRIIAEQRGVQVDVAEYQERMERAREIARGGGKLGESRLLELPPDVLAALAKSGVKPTDDSAKFNAAPIGTNVRAIWDGHRLIDHTHGSEAAGQGVAVVLDRTNFYAEMGGQVGDTGELRSAGGAVMDVSMTRVAGGYVLHAGNMTAGHLRVGEHVTAILAGVRPRTEQNHTATHLANWALREVLGEAVQQKGSLVDPEKLRFDFSHTKAVSEEEIARVETLVNQCVDRKMPVYAEVAPQEQALKINSLRAVFGEKYPPMVRVVSIGVPVTELLRNPSNADWRQYSIEFCGGTHLKNTADVGAFVITAEESVSKGVRRIVALTGDAGSSVARQDREVEHFLVRARAAAEKDVGVAIESLQQVLATRQLSLLTKRKVQATVAELQAKFKAWEKSQRGAGGAGVDPAAAAAALLAEAQPLGPAKLIVGSIHGAANEQLLAAMDSIKKKARSYAVMLASAEDGKVNFVAAVSDDLVAKGLKAGDWIRETAKVAGGGGGGRPQMAQAGGKDPSKLAEALETARRFAREKVPG